MSDTPVIFSEQEQLKLQELQSQTEGFATFRNAVSRSLHSGQDTKVIAELIQFLHNLSLQSAKQMEDVKVSAAARANDSKKKEV